MRFPFLAVLVAVTTWKGVSSRGGMGGGGRGGGGHSSGGHSSSAARSSSFSSSSSHSSAPSPSGSRSGGGIVPRASPSYHSSSISHASFTSSLLTSMAVSSMFHHSMSPYSHRYVYVAQDEKAPFRTNVTASRDYYFGEENIPVDNYTEITTVLNTTTGDDTIDLILAQTTLLLENNSTLNSTCNICTYKIDDNSTDSEWNQIEFKDGSRPSTIAWQCKRDEICCGVDCCEQQSEGELKWWMIVLISIGSALSVLILIKCIVSIRKWCSSDCRTQELGQAPPLTKLDNHPPPPPSAPVPPSYSHLNASHSAPRPPSAASLSGVQPNITKKQRKYEQN